MPRASQVGLYRAGGAIPAPAISDFTIAPKTTETSPQLLDLTSHGIVAGDACHAGCGISHGTITIALAGHSDDTAALIREDVQGADTKLRSVEIAVVSSLDDNLEATLSTNRRAGMFFATLTGAERGADAGQSSAGSASPSAPAVSTTGPNSRIIGAAHARGGHNLATLLAALPAGWESLGAVRTSASDDPSDNFESTVWVFTKVVPESGGSSGDATFADGLVSSRPWSAHQVEWRVPS